MSEIFRKGILSEIQNSIKAQIKSNPDGQRTPVGFLAALMTFPDGTPWPKNPHPFVPSKRGRPSKAVLEARKLREDWHYENITLPAKKMEEKYKGKITFKRRGL